MSPERALFSFRDLLAYTSGSSRVSPKSVRLRNDEVDVVVQSENEEPLRSQLAEVNGEVTGVTIEASGQRLTVFDDGQVVFIAPMGIATLVTAMGAVARNALRLPATAG